jgi:hypothetical protein
MKGDRKRGSVVTVNTVTFQVFVAALVEMGLWSVQTPPT